MEAVESAGEKSERMQWRVCGHCCVRALCTGQGIEAGADTRVKFLPPCDEWSTCTIANS
jgi:hypothetical protein